MDKHKPISGSYSFIQSSSDHDDEDVPFSFPGYVYALFSGWKTERKQRQKIKG